MIILAILLVAVYGLITSQDLIRKIMCLEVIEGLIILTFLKIGFGNAGSAPILTAGFSSELSVDPIPQALMLTAIVIGVCFNSLALVFLVRLHRHTGTLKVEELNER